MWMYTLASAGAVAAPNPSAMVAAAATAISVLRIMMVFLSKRGQADMGSAQSSISQGPPEWLMNGSALFQPNNDFTTPTALPMSIWPENLVFNSAMTLPMSLIDVAPTAVMMP